jgi:hypothetical protein
MVSSSTEAHAAEMDCSPFDVHVEAAYEAGSLREAVIEARMEVGKNSGLCSFEGDCQDCTLGLTDPKGFGLSSYAVPLSRVLPHISRVQR